MYIQLLDFRAGRDHEIFKPLSFSSILLTIPIGWAIISREKSSQGKPIFFFVLVKFVLLGYV